MIRAFLSAVPVPTAGLALGVVAVGKLAHDAMPGLEAACAAVALVLVLLVAGKAALCPRALARDLSQPVQAAVFGTFFMTVMQLSTYLAEGWLVAGQALWALAVIGHFALIAWFTWTRVRHFELTSVFATWFVCYVGVIVGSVTSPAVGFEAAGRALFLFGFACYLVLLAVVTARYRKHPVPEPAAPTFCIYAAPMSLSLAGYLAVFEPNVAFVVALEVLAQALFAVVLTRLPRFLAGPFYPSFAAMTFPFVITATALSRALSTLAAAGVAVPHALGALAAAEALFAAALTAYVLVRYVAFFAETLREQAAKRPHPTFG